MLAGGDTTDVITMKNVTDYARYASRGQLVAHHRRGQAARHREAGRASTPSSSDGKYFALPYRQDFWVLYYNKTLLRQGRRQGSAEPHLGRVREAREEAHHRAAAPTRSTAPTSTPGARWCRPSRPPRPAATCSAATTPSSPTSTRWRSGLQKAGATLTSAPPRRRRSTTHDVRDRQGRHDADGHVVHRRAAGRPRPTARPTSTGAWRRCRSVTRRQGVTTFGSPTAFAVNKKAKHADAAKKFVQWAAGQEGADAIAKIGVVPALHEPADHRHLLLASRACPPTRCPRRRSSRTRWCWRCRSARSPPTSTRSSTEEHELIMTGEQVGRRRHRRDGQAGQERSARLESRGLARAPLRPARSPKAPWPRCTHPAPPRPAHRRRLARHLVGWSFILPNFLGLRRCSRSSR